MIVRLVLYSLLLSAFTAFVASSTQSVSADVHQGDFEVQGVCVTGLDPRAATDPDFAMAVTGKDESGNYLFSTDANLNDPPHVHVDDLVKDGFIKSPQELFGHSYIFSGYWVEDGPQKHFRAYVPNGDAGLEEVPCSVALAITQDVKDQYLAPSVDVEMQRNHGLGSSGQTNTEQGRRRGEE